ncbi:DUF4142 domain-containing protein [Hymenobacter sp. BT683]|uniref:DUF4142 domain-containing protein n=1 Tax=Hymenobacter jeongseonensis TaxID=2791027 RepID=A0ABS0IF87_9BACT|nr:DUF4142 domain-containing protein [Hymenobacter jeongseonensis]MBF9237007.1 DUF4142 domain-containing protein [Hymenobacter jeongseonensis]
MKAISHFLAAAALVTGAACSSTSTSTDTGTAGTSTETGSPTAGATGMAANDMGAPAPVVTAADAATDEATFMGTFASMSDATFLMNTASSNLLETQAGQMAAQKARNPEVRKYAEMMVSHHTAATQELKAMASPLGVQLPPTMLPVHQAMLDKLRDKSGSDFDEAYMDLMEKAHKLDIAMFEVKSNAADKVQIQAFATKSLPALRTHLTMADAIEKKTD